MEEQKYANVSGTFISPPGSISARIGTVDPDPPVKPPWHRRFMYRNFKLAKPLLKEVIVEFVKWLILGRKRQPAQVSPPA